jgi:hypothetical protein
MRKLLQISLLGAIAVAISSCSSIKPLDSAGVAKLCTDNGGKLVKDVKKEGDKIISTKIICNTKMEVDGKERDHKLFSFDKDIQYPHWIRVKLSTAECVKKKKTVHGGKIDIDKAIEKSFDGLGDLISLLALTNKQLDEYREGVAKECKLDLSYKMYEKEKDAFNNVDVEVIK